MDTIMTEQERRSDRVGKIVATIGFILLVLLLLAPIFSYLNPPPGQPGILVNLGMVDAGQGNENAGPPPSPPRPEPEEVRVEPLPATPPPPAPATPEPQPEQREVITAEEAAEIALRQQREREEARRRAEQRRQQERAEAEQRRREQAEREARERAEREARERAAAERRRQAEADALKGQLGGAFGGGEGRGNTGQSGNQGVEDGDPDADRLEGISTGSGRVSGGLGGRGVLASPPVRENSQTQGVVVVEVCVNPDGRVTRVDFTQNGSSTADPSLVAAAERNAKQWRFAANELAPAEQCGRITYNFRVQ